jgi:predicted alpha/beta-fold hydrolase
MNSYRAPIWLPGAHLQTIVPALWARRATVRYRRERWTTPDDDFIDLDWLVGDAAPLAPLLVVFHGLEGSSASRYALGLMAGARDLGWHGVVPHFRGCSGEPNRAARFYHSGDSAEIDWVLRRLRGQFPAAPLYAAGVSLGGNVLLKWLGEQGAAALKIVSRTAAVSAPVDLAAGAFALGLTRNGVYVREFLSSLKPKSFAKLVQFPGLFDRDALLRARDMIGFDDAVTAPLHGFRDAADYYARSSSKPLLRSIAVPTLMLNARNDPFLPGDRLPRADEVSAEISLDFPAGGGHVGFWGIGGSDWMPARVLRFLAEGH